MKNHFIYVVVSHTITRVGKLIRIFGNIEFNHSAIALDEDLNELYAFARPQYRSLFLARLVKETYTSYTLNTDDPIPIKVFRIPVSEEEYQYVKETILRICADENIHYNFLSIISFPFIDGCSVSHTFTCSEFVAHILKDIGFSLPHPCCKYKPEHLVQILKDYLFFEGDIREIMSSENIDEDFFNSYSNKMVAKNLKTLGVVAKRSIHFKSTKKQQIK